LFVVLACEYLFGFLDVSTQINEGDGAFYGPKIDIGVFDAFKRKFQCATLQVL
jgi:threonyl-tRNA synthetase